MPTSYSFQCQRTDCGSGALFPNPADTNSTGIWVWTEPFIGSQNIAGGERLSSGMPPTNTWDYLTIQISVIGPSSETITAGLNVDSTNNSGIYQVETHFSIYAGSNLVGPYAYCEAQERIRRPQDNFDS